MYYVNKNLKYFKKKNIRYTFKNAKKNVLYVIEYIVIQKSINKKR